MLRQAWDCWDSIAYLKKQFDKFNNKPVPDIHEALFIFLLIAFQTHLGQR